MDLPPGHSVRPATLDDLDAVLAVINAGDVADIGEPMLERSDIEADWASPTIDLTTDVIVVVDGGEVVATAQVDGDRADVAIHPNARGRGVGSALVAWSEARAREAGAGRLGQTVPSSKEAATALLAARGYQPQFESWVLRLPPDVVLDGPVPAEIEIRRYQPEEQEAVYTVIENAFSEWEGRSPRSYEAWRVAVTERSDFDPSLLLVALADSDIVGAGIGVTYPDEGWVDQVAVDARFRGRGIATALLAELFRLFRSRGQTRLGLNTDSRTGALDLYLNLGMFVEHSYTHWAIDFPSSDESTVG